MAVTKPYEFIGFGAMEVTKPYEFILFGAMEVTKPYEFIGFGAMKVTKPYDQRNNPPTLYYWVPECQSGGFLYRHEMALELVSGQPVSTNQKTIGEWFG